MRCIIIIYAKVSNSMNARPEINLDGEGKTDKLDNKIKSH